MTQVCDSRDGFKLKHVIDHRNIGIVDYEYINESNIQKSSSPLILCQKKYRFYLKLMFLTPGKLLPFKLAFSRLSLSDGNWVRLFSSFGSDIITKMFSMGCHDNSVLFGYTNLFPPLTIYLNIHLFLSISAISPM